MFFPEELFSKKHVHNKETDLEQLDVSRFAKKTAENDKFQTRLGDMSDFEGKTVLDVGCGQGGLCIDMALAGAEKIIGLDIEKRVIDFGIKNME
ncbi:methyltransferase domain-containing protein [Candidatus Latescibacterota bacterium]